MKSTVIILLLVCITISGFCEGENPQAEISNGILKASLYLPNAENGYYRACRFDWSGLISSLEYKGHNYFGKWFEGYNPTTHDAVVGPVDAFDPLNYNESRVGASFVKIGIGSLKKTSDRPYKPFTTYPIIDAGTWEIERERAQIQFHHVLNDKDYPYEYSKTIEFIEGKAEMRISYRLKNTGIHTIETQVFNHNFFMFDDQPVGKGFELTFIKDISCSGENRGFGDIAVIEENKLKITRPLLRGESVYCASIGGIEDKGLDYHIEIECRETSSGVRIKGNQPLSKLVFWCHPKTICPEPYIKIRIEAGEEFTWETGYEFYAETVGNKTKL